MEFFDVVKNRYSCKKFDGRQVDAAQLKAILEAGRLAPTAKELAQEPRRFMWCNRRRDWPRSTR